MSDEQAPPKTLREVEPTIEQAGVLHVLAKKIHDAARDAAERSIQKGSWSGGPAIEGRTLYYVGEISEKIIRAAIEVQHSDHFGDFEV